jgi:hypothetical protein
MALNSGLNVSWTGNDYGRKAEEVNDILCYE